MATFDAVKDILGNGMADIFSSVHSVSTMQDVGEAVKIAIFTYPDPAVRVASAAVLFGVIAFILGWITDKYSWVDKFWSILPAYYAWVIAFNAPGGEIHPRLLQMAALISLWSLRLTYNFYRKVISDFF
jgi:steroid 5-alpha reductase family enzyme